MLEIFGDEIDLEVCVDEVAWARTSEDDDGQGGELASCADHAEAWGQPTQLDGLTELDAVRATLGGGEAVRWGLDADL